MENVQITTISVRHLQNSHVIGCCHHQHGLLHHVFLSSGHAPFLSSMHMFFPSFVFIWPQRFEPGAVLWFGFMFIAHHNIANLLVFFWCPPKIMSLTALPVCRGTPRLKFHGMKISARLFSLSQFVTAFGVGLSWHLFSSDVRIFSRS